MELMLWHMNTFIPKTSFCTWEKANLLHPSGMVSTAHFQLPDWSPPKVRGQPQLRQEELGKLIALSQTKIQIKQVTTRIPFLQVSIRVQSKIYCKDSKNNHRLQPCR